MGPSTSKIPALILVIAACLCACSPAPQRPSPTATASTTPRPAIAPDQAFYILHRLVAASGSDKLLKVRMTSDSAEVAVVTPSGAQTWAWRDGGPTQVDGDTRDVGQERFRLSDFRFDNFPLLFSTAASISGSTSGQELQVVEYNADRIFITVTTVPETTTVFFRPDGTLVPRLDFSKADDFARGFQDVTEGSSRLLRWGLTPELGMYADLQTPTGLQVRRVRSPRFPTREESVPAPTSPTIFDAHALDVSLLHARVYSGQPTSKPSAEVSVNASLHAPLIRVAAEGKTHYFSLDGDDVTSQVK